MSPLWRHVHATAAPPSRCGGGGRAAGSGTYLAPSRYRLAKGPSRMTETSLSRPPQGLDTSTRRSRGRGGATRPRRGKAQSVAASRAQSTHAHRPRLQRRATPERSPRAGARRPQGRPGIGSGFSGRVSVLRSTEAYGQPTSACCPRGGSSHQRGCAALPLPPQSDHRRDPRLRRSRSTPSRLPVTLNPSTATARVARPGRLTPRSDPWRAPGPRRGP